ncbi:MAG: hypothetical protein HOP08_13385 [Cyclobacteriaceae bacterium]|nr:hypothetical protein [Cyclobacteriaceae bacterium]
MPQFNPKQVEEINGIIETIKKSVKKGSEIGAREKTTLSALLRANKIEKKAKHFPCIREYSSAIVSHFVKEEGLKLNKFSMNLQTSIYLID